MSDDNTPKMVPEDQREIMFEFLSESEEHLEILNDKMLDVEASIKNNTEMSGDDLNTMFRGAHTIKGTASFIGLDRVVGLTHKAETLLQKLRDKEIDLSQAIVDALFSAFDTLTSLLNCLKENFTEDVDIGKDVAQIEALLNPDAAPPPAAEPAPTETEAPKEEPPQEAPTTEPIIEKYLDQFISEADSNVEALDSLILQAEKEKNNKELINTIFRHMHTIKGSAGIINATQIQEVAHRMENILHVFRENDFSFNDTVIGLLFEVLDMIKGFLDSLRNDKCIKTNITDICAKLDNFNDFEPSPMPVEPKPAEQQPPEVAKTVVPPPSQTTPSKQTQEQSSSEDTLKIAEDAFDDMLDIKTLSKEENNILQESIQNDFDYYLLGFSISKDVDVKGMKIAIIEERLKKNGIIVSIRPDQNTIDASINNHLLLGIIYCSNISQEEIKGLFSLDCVELHSIEYGDKALVKTEEALPQEVIPKEEPAASKPIPQAVPKIDEKPKGEKMTAPTQSPTAVASKEKSSGMDISTIKIDSRKLDKLMNLSGELVIIRAQYARLVNLFNGETSAHREISQTASNIQENFNTLSKEFSNTGLFEKVDGRNSISLQKIMSEIKDDIEGLYQNLIKNDLIDNIHDLNETTSNLQKVSSDIQAGVMQTRMVPIEGVFTRFKRIVRDISKDLNKDVNLEIIGAETELDKKIVDSLGDPLTHMIRNAVDHGLEDTPTRIATGKNPQGRITLKACHKGNSICIEISDDGKGIDAEKLVESAMKKGLLTPDQTDRMSEKEKLNIMFLPGFSTAEKVTGLSGRGVGMDVVRNMITSLNGTVDIYTEIDKGTNFVLKIPLTLAIIQALLVSIGEEMYAFPLDSVTEIIKVLPGEIYSVDGNTTVKLRDHALSLVELEKVIYIKNPNKKENIEGEKVIIITDGETKLGVSVDNLVGKDEIVIKPFTEHFANVKGITGASILADGNVAIILDPATIIKESR